jgi:hypothetical protein
MATSEIARDAVKADFEDHSLLGLDKVYLSKCDIDYKSIKRFASANFISLMLRCSQLWNLFTSQCSARKLLLFYKHLQLMSQHNNWYFPLRLCKIIQT